VKYLMRLPFVLFAVWLGGGLWWVARRLFGNEGGAIALGLYVLCPEVVRYATHPNNEVLALWGLYGLVYTAIGVAHALQGPRAKWKPRILLLATALGLTAAAHVLAAVLGFIAGLALLYYLAEGRRSQVAQIMVFAATGSFGILLASFGFRPSAFLYVFTGGSARFWFTTQALRNFCASPTNAGILVAAAVALVVYFSSRPSRYFGNTTPLIMTLVLFLIYTTQVMSAPWVWALPFLFTFIGGVFADILESRQRKLFLALSAAILITQAALCWTNLAGLTL
jgi:hypothetical protein